MKSLFSEIEALSTAVNKELAEQLLKCQRTLNPKNLGGIEVPDGARLAIEFLDRRLEVFVQPLANVGGRPAPVGPLATASVIQYDRTNPSAADWFDIALREDGAWHRKTADGTGAAFAEKDMRSLLEWLVSSSSRTVVTPAPRARAMTPSWARRTARSDTVCRSNPRPPRYTPKEAVRCAHEGVTRAPAAHTSGSA